MIKKMRVTMHCGKGYREHNDHKKGKREPSTQIDYAKTKYNVLWTCMDNAEKKHTIAEGEILFYEDFFGSTLKRTNDKYVSKGQYGRVRDMKSWSKAERHRPEEVMLQIGKKGEFSDKQTFIKAINRFMAWQKKRFEGNLKIISASVHADETSYHCHLREVWYHIDSEGLPVPGIKAAMRAMNVPLPRPDEPESKDNYRKAVIDAERRAKWQEICKELGLDIECTPDKERQLGHMGCEAYANYMNGKESLDARESSLGAQEAVLKRRDEELSTKEEKLLKKASTLSEQETELESYKTKLNQRSRNLSDRLEKCKEREEELKDITDAAEDGLEQINQLLSKLRGCLPAQRMAILESEAKRVAKMPDWYGDYQKSTQRVNPEISF